MSGSFESVQTNASVQRSGLGLYSHPKRNREQANMFYTAVLCRGNGWMASLLSQKYGLVVLEHGFRSDWR